MLIFVIVSTTGVPTIASKRSPTPPRRLMPCAVLSVSRSIARSACSVALVTLLMKKPVSCAWAERMLARTDASTSGIDGDCIIVV